MSVAQIIRTKLEAALSPDTLDVIDQSALHAGHSGAPDGGESHFRLYIVSVAFAGKSRLQRQRLINDLLKQELAGPIHALSMELLEPSQVA